MDRYFSHILWSNYLPANEVVKYSTSENQKYFIDRKWTSMLDPFNIHKFIEYVLIFVYNII